jgi:hypothetical protein
VRSLWAKPCEASEPSLQALETSENAKALAAFACEAGVMRLPPRFKEELAMLRSAADPIVMHPLDSDDAVITNAMRAVIISANFRGRGLEGLCR